MARRFRLPRSVSELVEFYTRYVSPVSLIAGFISDNMFLAKRVDLFLTNALLFAYLIVSALGIVVINLIQSGRWQHRWALGALPVLPVVVQFAFGGLFSAYLSLYSRSADVAVSWIFVFVVAALILLNERFSHFYNRFSVQVPIYFTVLFSFLIFFLPVVFRQIGPLMFVFSGLVSVAIITGFLWFLWWLVPEVVRDNRRTIGYAILSIYVLFNIFYFAGAIPPLPLALKQAGVYHSIDRLPDGSYQLEAEPLPWYEKFLNFSPVFHRASDQPVYVWTAIFAPTGLNTEILHQWQWYDATSSNWTTESTISFLVTGGRDGGYRGYSEKSNLPSGQWRVNVITPYGALLGRVSFEIVDASSTPPLVGSTE